MNLPQAVAMLALLSMVQLSVQVDTELQLPPAIHEDLTAEGYILVDQKALEKYRTEERSEAAVRVAVKKEVEYLLTQVNEYYESLKPYGLRLQLRVVDIEILNGDLVSGKEIKTNDEVDETVILKNFGNFLPHAQRSKDEYDFAILLTGYDLSDPTAGFAKLGMMCWDYARGVVEMHGNFGTASIFAHEVGHIFGANHDPVGAPHIMAPESSNEPDDRIFLFSKLTADFILKYLRKSPRNIDCLRHTSRWSTIPSISPADFDGKMQDVHYLCKRAVDPRSTPCTSAHFYNNKTSIAGDSVCFHVACRKTDNPLMCVTSVRTPEGMACGQNRVCQRGKCVFAPSEKTRNVNSQCLFGDDKNPYAVMQSCQAHLKLKGGQKCENNNWLTSCCETCQRYRTGWSDCPYGDAGEVIYGDVRMTCPQMIAQRGKNEACLVAFGKSCCGSCHLPDHLKGTSCPYGDDNYIKFNGKMLTCAQAIGKYGKRVICLNEYSSKRCCKSCGKTGSADCPYGDESVIGWNGVRMTCPQMIAQTGKNQACLISFQKACCGSCQLPDSLKGSSCPYGDDNFLNVDKKMQTCAQLIDNHGKTLVCGDPYMNRRCCKSCEKPASTGDCPYGDDSHITVDQKRTTCRAALDKLGIYVLCNEWGKKHCCKTCHVPPGAPANCQYGDAATVVINKRRVSCSSAAKRYTKEWLCSTRLARYCCVTCGNS